MSIPDPPEVVVIGASAGGIEPLRRLFELIPASSPRAYFVVVHLPQYAGSVLPEVIGATSRMPVAFAKAGERIRAGSVTVAPPGSHTLLTADGVRTSGGPRENGHRPAIDPLFRSAAAAHGSRATGVILSGALDDGVAGLAAVAKAGGRTYVQDPSEALHPSMPRNAIERVPVDAVLGIDALAAQLRRPSAVTDGNGAREPRSPREARMSKRMSDAGGSAEQSAALPGGDAEIERLDRIGEPTGLTCPGCGGALWQVESDGVPVMRCHVGHVYGFESFSHEQSIALETALWAAIRALEEKQALLERLGENAERAGRSHSATEFLARAEEMQARAQSVRSVAEAVAASVSGEIQIPEGATLA